MDDSLWGNLFSADDPMTPQLEFRGGNGHTGKSVIIRSGRHLYIDRYRVIVTMSHSMTHMTH